MADDAAQGAGEDFLDGGDAVAGERGGAFVGGDEGLGLPAVVGGSAIGEGEFVALGGHE